MKARGDRVDDGLVVPLHLDLRRSCLPLSSSWGLDLVQEGCELAHHRLGVACHLDLDRLGLALALAPLPLALRLVLRWGPGCRQLDGDA